MPPAHNAALAPGGRRSLGLKAYEIIYRKIITLEYEPGRHLEESQLVDQLGIGRTPIREALQRLADDLLVESQPGKSFVVRALTLQNTKSAFAALQVLELGAAGIIVRQDVGRWVEEMEAANAEVITAVKGMNILQLVDANNTFHDAYARCSQNIYLIQPLQKVRCETYRLAYLSYGYEIDPQRSLQEHYASVIEQHNQIIAAVRNRDEAQLKQIVVEHIETFKDRVINYLAGF